MSTIRYFFFAPVDHGHAASAELALDGVTAREHRIELVHHIEVLNTGDGTWLQLPAEGWDIVDEQTKQWLGQVATTWKEVYGGVLQRNRARKVLQPLVKEHGAEEVCRRLANYGAATEAQYASIVRFAETFGVWAEAKQARADRRAIDLLPNDRPVTVTVS